MSKRDEREALIEKAVSAMYEDSFGHRPGAWEPDEYAEWADMARAALTVFQQSLSTTRTVNILREDWERFKQWEQSTPVPADALEALAQASLDSERLRQIGEWLAMEHGHEETAKRVSMIADRHDRLAAWLQEQGYRREPVVDRRIMNLRRVLETDYNGTTGRDWIDSGLGGPLAKDLLAIIEAPAPRAEHPEPTEPTELERLRGWKAQAMTVLSEWEETWIAAGRPGRPGTSKAVSVRAELERLRAAGRAER